MPSKTLSQTRALQDSFGLYLRGVMVLGVILATLCNLPAIGAGWVNQMPGIEHTASSTGDERNDPTEETTDVWTHPGRPNQSRVHATIHARAKVVSWSAQFLLSAVDSLQFRNTPLTHQRFSLPNGLRAPLRC